MLRFTALVAGWLGCVALAAAAVQTPPQTPPGTRSQKPPVFTKQVDLVRLDVSVLGKDRLPVRGLTANDFIVQEDGKPQKVVALQEVVMDDAPPPPVAWMRDVTPDVTTNTIEDSRLIIIVIDDALIPLDPRITRDTKKILADVINKLSPSDYTAMVFTADGRKAQDFTHDRTTLLAAAERFTGGIASYTFGSESTGPHGIQVDPDSHYYWSTVNTLATISDFLVAVPQRRKALIWISPGVPVNPAGSGPMMGPSIAGDGGAPGGSGKPGAAPPPSQPIQGFVSDHEIMARLADDTRDLFRRAQRANVVIYPIDPTGLGGLERYIQGHVSKGAPSELAHQKATLSFEFVETAAANTGGHAIVNTEDFGPGINQIFKENGSVLIGFQPLNAKDDGTLRRIDVKVNRPGVEVIARSGYYAPSAADNAKVAKASENVVLAKAIGGLLPATDLPLGVSVAPFAIPGQHTAAVAIAMGVRQPVPPEAAKGKVTETTELQISAFTPDGDARGTQRSTAHVRLVQGATGDAEYEVLGRIDLAPGRYSLRLAAHNATSRKTGSVAANVIVPDFTNEAFSISGVVLNRTPAKQSAPKDLLTSVVPLVPTADRELATANRATAFLRLYQSGKKPVGEVSLVIRIANDHGGTDVNETQVLGVDRFVTTEPAAQTASSGPATGPGIPFGSGPPSSRGRSVGQPAPEKANPFANQWLRTADVRYALPLSTLARGQYLLTFEATAGTTTLRRDVRFTVK